MAGRKKAPIDRREEDIRLLQAAAGADQSLAEHMHDNQIDPQRIAHELRAKGEDVDVTMVNTDPNAAEGFEVSCFLCGRTARMPFPPPEGKVVVCPTCQRSRA